jgi:predicted ester cyclase
MSLVNAMLEGLGKFAEGGAEAMELDKFWHPKMNWYGPAGIGSNRRISGFRNWHQIPFLNAMPDRSSDKENGGYDCYFADGDYVLFCGWPGMKATITGDGWMRIAPSGQKIDMTSLDIWRCENGLIRENWVMIDILDIWHQLGVDVLAHMREMT